jgi:hypothetical protein
MNDAERIAILETKVDGMKESIAELLRDIKVMQYRWAFLLGGLNILMNLPNILQFMRHP